MDFEKIDEELAAADQTGNNRERYNTVALIADLKQSNRTPKLIILSALLIIAVAAAILIPLYGSQDTATATTVSSQTTDAGSDAASDKTR